MKLSNQFPQFDSRCGSFIKLAGYCWALISIDECWWSLLIIADHADHCWSLLIIAEHYRLLLIIADHCLLAILERIHSVSCFSSFMILPNILTPYIKNLETYFAISICFEFWPMWWMMSLLIMPVHSCILISKIRPRIYFDRSFIGRDWLDSPSSSRCSSYVFLLLDYY